MCNVLNYDMGLRTTCTLPEIRECVAGILDVGLDADGRAIAGGLSVSVWSVDDPPYLQVYTDLLGLPATASVFLAVDNKGDEGLYIQARKAMAITATQLAVQTDAEACLTFQLDGALMRRRSGVLYLYDGYTDWLEPEVLDQLPQPYTVAPDEGILQ